MTGSALLELREARANLARSEDEAEEQKALEIYRAVCHLFNVWFSCPFFRRTLPPSTGFKAILSLHS